MKDNSKFQPIYGSEKAIAKEPIKPGQLYVSDEGNMYLDTNDERIPVADKTMTRVFKQETPSPVWQIEHNLSRYPSITIQDNDKNELIGDVNYVSENVIEITFTRACSGTVYLN